MTLRLADRWIWDFWLARDGRDYHVFYLQAPRSLGDAELRHWNVSIGHAVSQDLQNWRVLPDALCPSSDESDAFDTYTTWTGSVIQHRGLWHLFYTGGKGSEDGLVQRIGLATSSDLIHWEKHSENPLIVADPRWYELLNLELWHDQAWRDPWVFRHPDRGDFHAFVTARAARGAVDGRGVIGHARSEDLVHWEVLPPVTEPGDFGHLEVPQLERIQGQYYLLFSVQQSVHSTRWIHRTGHEPLTGIRYLVTDDPLGPFHVIGDGLLVGDELGSLYSGKLVEDPAGEWVLMATRMHAPDGTFVGELNDPVAVAVSEEGALSVHREQVLVQ
ncbi:MAG: glycosyl hydrolase family 32 [Anaerolineae bacterium]|jgi:beta-fructofuranosidase